MLEDFKKDVKEFLGEDVEQTVIAPTLGQINVNDLRLQMERLSENKCSSEDELILEVQGQVKLLKLRMDSIEVQVAELRKALLNT